MAKIWPGLGEAYVCPLCRDAYRRAGLETDPPRLTLEDVPPKSVGGRVLLLTCADCNHRAGTEVDAELERSVDHALFAEGAIRDPLQVRLSSPGLPDLAAEFAATPAGLRLRFVPKASRPGAAEQWSNAALNSTLRGQPLDARATTRSRVRPFGARVSLLRATYLAAFAKFGHSYALRPELELVRQQIAQNKRLIIPYFSASGQATFAEGPQLAVAELTGGPNAVIAGFGRQLIFLPWHGSAAEIYGHLKQLADSNQAVAFSAVAEIGWPGGLELLWDDALPTGIVAGQFTAP